MPALFLRGIQAREFQVLNQWKNRKNHKNLRNNPSDFYIWRIMTSLSIPLYKSTGCQWGLPLAALFLASTAPIGASTYTVDAPGSLTTIAAQIQASPASDKVHHVRFKSYQNVGAFSLTSLAADSLIFERDSESAEVVVFSGTLFQMKNINAAVVFHNLAFKAQNAASIWLDAQVGSSPNRNLLLDSCQIFADSINTTVLSWLGDTGSRVEFKRSFLATTRGGPSAKIDLNSNALTLSNCYVNFPGVLAATTAGPLSFTNNTFNRVQFQLNGNFSGTYAFARNLFAHPPAQNRLSVGGAQKFLMAPLVTYASGTASQNARFDTWAGYDHPSSAAFPSPSNSTLSPFGDSLALWNFNSTGDSVRGYLNPSGSFPAYTVYPSDSTLSIRLSVRDSIIAAFSAALIPRSISIIYGTTAYPNTTDSTRTFWFKDTTIQMAGPVAIKSLRFPQGVPSGLPILFSQSGVSFVPGVLGQESGLDFANNSPSSKVFIPAFAGQNTPKGSNMAVKGLSADTALIFAAVTQAGRTFILTPSLTSSNKRWRFIQQGGKSLRLRDSTNARATGQVQFGLAKVGADAPFIADSLTWWLGGNSFSTATDSLGKYWGKAPSAPPFQSILIERLAIGKGGDTLLLPQGRTISVSANGHQLKVDSSFLPTQSLFPDMGSFSHGISMDWPGRKAGDSLFLELKKSTSFQKAFVLAGNTATPLTPVKEDSATVTVALEIGDSGKPVFLAHRYSIAANVKTDLALGQDSIKALLSTTPGGIGLDTNFVPTGLDLTSARVMAKRNISLTNLQVQGNYKLVLNAKAPGLPDSVKVRVFDGSAWDTASYSTAGANRYSVTLTPNSKYVLIYETLLGPDSIPNPPSNPPTILLQGNRFNVTLNLTNAEKTKIKSFRLDLFAMDRNGKMSNATANFLPIDSTASMDLKPETIYAYRIIYQSPGDKVSLDTTWIPLNGTSLNPSALQQSVPLQKARFQHLVGFPFSGTYSQNLEPGLSSKVAADKVFLRKLSNGNWVSLPANANPVLERGAGYLMATTVPFQPKINSSSLPNLIPDTLHLQETGWHLVSNPFPFPFQDAKIKLDTSAVSLFRTLRRLDTAASSTGYDWPIVDTLNPFEGFLVYAFKPTNLIFDPFVPSRAQGAGKVSAELPSQQLNLVLSDENDFSSMSFYSAGPYRPTPYFPAPDARLEMKVGGNGGFYMKPVSRLDSLREDMEIVSTTGGAVTLSVSGSGIRKPKASSQQLPDMRLIDLQSGRVYQSQEFNAVQVQSGSNTFKFLTGPSANLDKAVETYLNGLPSAFSLEQNFPNPFQGQTRIKFNIPARLGKILKGKIEVFNLSGKTMAVVPLDGLTVGSRTMSLSNANWKPGIYFYQLSIHTDRGILAQRKKMILEAQAK